MTASEDRELHPWLSVAHHYGGGFIATLAEAALRADECNYAILRPTLLQFREKYPQYDDERFRMRAER